MIPMGALIRVLEEHGEYCLHCECEDPTIHFDPTRQALHCIFCGEGTMLFENIINQAWNLPYDYLERMISLPAEVTNKEQIGDDVWITDGRALAEIAGDIEYSYPDREKFKETNCISQMFGRIDLDKYEKAEIALTYYKSFGQDFAMLISKNHTVYIKNEYFEHFGGIYEPYIADPLKPVLIKKGSKVCGIVMPVRFTPPEYETEIHLATFKELSTKLIQKLHGNPIWISAKTERNTLKAISLYYQLLNEYPVYQKEVYQKIGSIYFFGVGNLVKAKEAFAKALEQEPHDDYSNLMLGKIYEATDDVSAEDYYTNAALANRIHKIELARFYVRQHRYSEAILSLKDCNDTFLVANSSNSYKPACFVTAIAHYLNGDTDNASRFYRSSEIFNVDENVMKLEMNELQLKNYEWNEIEEFFSNINQ